MLGHYFVVFADCKYVIFKALGCAERLDARRRKTTCLAEGAYMEDIRQRMGAKAGETRASAMKTDWLQVKRLMCDRDRTDTHTIQY